MTRRVIEDPIALRGTGRTTQQIKDAPHRAMFFWCADSGLNYPRSLCRHLNRPDVFVCPRRDLIRPCGLRRSQVVVDHAAILTDEERAFLGSMSP